MDIKDALYNFLISKSALTDIIGESDSARLYPDEAPQGVERPYITYQIENEERATNLRGASEYCDSMVTFTIHADTTSDRQDVKEAMRNILHMQLNVALDGPVYMRFAKLENAKDSYLSPEDASETGGLFMCELDFRVVFFETAPTGGDMPVDIQTFTSSGTWTKPTGGQTTARIFMTGGGAGGGSGRQGAAGTARGGGGGASGAGCVLAQVSLALLSATEVVSLGAGGAGGAAVSASDTNGNVGIAGGISTFGTKFRATGGIPGSGGTTGGGSGGSPIGAADNTTSPQPMGTDVWSENVGDIGGFGGKGTTGAAVSSINCGQNNPSGPAAGGGGGGISAGDVDGSGGNGGGGSNGLAGAAGGATTVAGTAASGLAGTGCNGGGGGGSRAIGGAGIYGSGGGGGGAGLNSVANSGAGGAGGAGVCVVICW